MPSVMVIEDAATSKDAKYALESVLNHILIYQSIIGLEAQKYMQKLGIYPDLALSCYGGGSNFSAVSTPFVCDMIYGNNVKVIGAEPSSCPTMTKGPFAYDFGELAKTTSLLPMYALGHDYIPAPIHTCVKWARSEAFIPATETNHVLVTVVDEAMRTKEEGNEKNILFNWSGHGLVDFAAYDAHFSGKLEAYELPDEEVERSLNAIKDFPKP
jgi:tryptophan synthase beta chain